MENEKRATNFIQSPRLRHKTVKTRDKTSVLLLFSDRAHNYDF